MNKALRVIGLIAVIGVLMAAIIASMNMKTPNTELVWDSAATIGNPEASNYFIIYSDMVCPYCIAFENAIVEHEDEFQQYIAENDILVEVRLSDFLYEFGEGNPIHSRYAALATYCARDEGKFWDYYNLAVTRVWNDFFKVSGKTGGAVLSAKDQTYWTNIGHEIGLGESFDNCVAEQTPLAEIVANAAKSAKTAHGMPYFKFNNFTQSGFDMNAGWDTVLQFFEAGLNSR